MLRLRQPRREQTFTVVNSLRGLDAATEVAKGETIMTTGKELYGPVGAKEPILFHGKRGWIQVHCHECNEDYDIREIENETTHPHALHVARFDCPRGHRSEARRVFTEKVV
jgi:hypothetical protein